MRPPHAKPPTDITGKATLEIILEGDTRFRLKHGVWWSPRYTLYILILVGADCTDIGESGISNGISTLLITLITRRTLPQ